MLNRVLLTLMIALVVLLPFAAALAQYSRP